MEFKKCHFLSADTGEKNVHAKQEHDSIIQSQKKKEREAQWSEEEKCLLSFMKQVKVRGEV